MNQNDLYHALLFLFPVVIFIFRKTSKITYTNRFVFGLNFVVYFFITAQFGSAAFFGTKTNQGNTINELLFFGDFFSEFFPNDNLEFISFIYFIVLTLFCLPKYHKFKTDAPFKSNQKIKDTIMMYGVFFIIVTFPFALKYLLK